MITREQGIEIAQKIEQLIIPLKAHCALGGSLLHKGTSEKDVDIFIYPHKHDYSTSKVIASLKDAGFAFDISLAKRVEEAYAKEVQKALFNNIRVDIFFL